MSANNRPYIGRAVTLERAISALEGWVFGKHLRFVTTGYGDQLSIDTQGAHYDLKPFCELPKLRELAEDLNAVCEPVLQRYADSLRTELALECLKLAQKSLNPPQGSEP